MNVISQSYLVGGSEMGDVSRGDVFWDKSSNKRNVKIEKLIPNDLL